MADGETSCAVTAVIPAYRAADRIGATIASFLEQPGIAPSVIAVIDDGCDRTAEVARQFGSQVTVLVNERNLGASASRNRGLAAVATRYVHFLDADDRVEGPLIASLAMTAEREHCDICFGRYTVEVEGSGERLAGPPLTGQRDTLFAEWLTGTAYAPPVSVLWRTAAVRAVGGWNEEVSRNDDAELVLRALLKGVRFGFAQEGLGIYVWHPSPHRVSKQSTRIGDMLHIIRALLAIDGPAVDPSIVRHAAGEAAYEIARVAFAEEQPAVGREALRLARELGCEGHRGGRPARWLSTMIGLENRMRLRALVRTTGAPVGRSDFERATATGRN